MKVRKIAFVGTRTDQPEAMTDLFERVLGLEPTHAGGDMWAYRLPDGSIAEVFGPSLNDHFTTGPVTEFLVDDVGGSDRGAPKGGGRDCVRSRAIEEGASHLGALPRARRQPLRRDRGTRPGGVRPDPRGQDDD